MKTTIFILLTILFMASCSSETPVQKESTQNVPADELAEQDLTEQEEPELPTGKPCENRPNSRLLPCSCIVTRGFICHDAKASPNSVELSLWNVAGVTLPPGTVITFTHDAESCTGIDDGEGNELVGWNYECGTGCVVTSKKSIPNNRKMLHVRLTGCDYSDKRSVNVQYSIEYFEEDTQLIRRPQGSARLWVFD